MSRQIRRLRDQAKLLQVCGGPTNLGRLIGRSKQWVSDYKGELFPATSYRLICDALKPLGYQPHLDLFNFDRLPADRK